MASGELVEYGGTKTISLGTVTAPVVTANHIVLNAETSTNSKFVGVLLEEHHHYGSNDCNGRKEQPGSKAKEAFISGNFQLDRNTLAKLIAKYKEEEGWLYPLPWEQNLKLEPEEFYVELTLDAYSKNGLYSKGVNAKVEDVFDPILPGGLPVQRVLIQGNAGYGKSSLCQKAVYDWAHGITTFRALPWESSLPVLIKLRYLDQASNLEKIIFDLIASYYTPPEGHQEVESFMKSLGRNLVIILDGYDEVDQGSQCNVINLLESWKLLSKDSPLCSASLLVTTRPTSDEKFLLMFEKHYFITSISDDNVETLVKKFNTYTCSLIGECVSQLDKLLSKFFRHPKTRLLETFLNKKTKKKVYLREMPPLIIAVICWVIKQPRVDFRSNDIIYNCLELLSKRCNQREQFGFTDNHVADVLLRFGLLCFKIEKTVIEEKLLWSELKSDSSFLVLTGILKCSGGHDGIYLWEPVHKSFLDALVYAALASDEVETLSHSEIKEFLKSDITTSCDSITMHVSIAANNIIFGGTVFGLSSPEKTVFLKWNEKYKNVSYLHKLEPTVDLVFSLNIQYFDTENLEEFIKDFPNFLPLVKESRVIQTLLNAQGEKLYAMSFGLNQPVKDSLNLFFPDTQNVFAKLITYGVRLINIKKQGNVNLLVEVLRKLFGLPYDFARRPSCAPNMYFSDIIRNFKEAGLHDWEITLHCIAHSKVSQHSFTLKFSSKECPSRNCRWEQIREINIRRVGSRHLKSAFPASFLWRVFKDVSDSSSESEESTLNLRKKTTRETKRVELI